MGGRRRWSALAAVALAAVVAACGGDDSTAPSPPPAATNTITITSSGVSPKNIAVARGSQVTFVNNESKPHEMASDPHPEHTDCPEINSVGVLSNGQSRQTGNLNTARTCGFHDHEDPFNNALKGSIVIQ